MSGKETTTKRRPMTDQKGKIYGRRFIVRQLFTLGHRLPPYLSTPAEAMTSSAASSLGALFAKNDARPDFFLAT